MHALPLRPADRADLASLVLLSMAMLDENGQIDARFTPHGDARAGEEARLLKSVDDPEHVVLVAEEKPGLIVGYAAGQLGRTNGLRTTLRPGTITACFVVPARRRRGIARTLATLVAARLTALGADELRLHVVSQNSASLAFWASLGYVPYEELFDRPVA